jgi:antitoxin component of MazEF toxin-antitoxin module
MAAGVDIGRCRKIGDSAHVLIPKQIWDQLRWRFDDRVCMRIAGEKLILERVPIEELARVKTAPAEVQP